MQLKVLTWGHIGPLTLEFQASRTMRNGNVCSSIYLVSGVLLQQHKWTKATTYYVVVVVCSVSEINDPLIESFPTWIVYQIA